MKRIEVVSDVGKLNESLACISLEHPYAIHQTAEWYVTYINGLGVSDHVRLLNVTDDNGQLLGCLPLEVRYRRGTRFWQHRYLTILAEGPTDFYTLLVAPQHTREYARAVVSWLKVNSNRWERLHLTLIPKVTVGWQDLVSQLVAEGFAPRVTQDRSYYEVDTTCDWEQYYEEYLVPNNRDLWKSMRRIERDSHTVHFEIIRSGVSEALRELLPLYRQRRESNNQPNRYEDQSYWNFIRQTIDAYETHRWVELSVARDTNGNPWAYQLDWLYSGVRFHYQTAYNDEFARYSPGKLLLFEILKRSFADPAIKACNFMRGEAPYKRSLARDRQAYVEILLDNPYSLRSKATRAASRLLRVRDSLVRRTKNN